MGIWKFYRLHGFENPSRALKGFTSEQYGIQLAWNKNGGIDKPTEMYSGLGNRAWKPQIPNRKSMQEFVELRV